MLSLKQQSNQNHFKEDGIMRGSAVTLLLIGVFALVFAPAVFAQQADTPPKPAAGPAPVSKGEPPIKDTPAADMPKPQPGSKDMTGDVTGMDAAAKTLMVKAKKGEMTFDVSDAQWMGYNSMADVKAGDRVRVSYMKKDGKMMASMVYKRQGSTKPADTAPKP
jgi:hypothetical protein